MRTVSSSRFLSILGAVLYLCCANAAGFANADRLPGAAVADRFLSGIARAKFGERKELLSGIVWRSCSFAAPAFALAETVSEAIVETDTEGVLGYERTVRLRASVRMGSAAQRVMLFRLLAYAERGSGKWKVWSFQEARNDESCLQLWRDQAGDPSQTEPTYWSNCGRYLALVGHLKEGLSAYERAAESSRTDPQGGSADDLDGVVEDLRKIIGE